ncbi:hypothetical protein EB796_001302 [Bugula neritina]|uniref:Uncharacterized protein n=1 Tax=Bugula neritina TaxID=10212 RepID=A0A7J7JRZ8_BUGNE|nr:hypothetical protein EB796_012926 [Bugula neritina]KAF6040396.1 hypothetical protein EB796_001302 [Bugula neritina]
MFRIKMAKLLFLVNLKATPTPKLLSISHTIGYFWLTRVVTKITILNILFPKIYFIAAEISNSPRCQSKLLLRKHRTDC